MTWGDEGRKWRLFLASASIPASSSGVELSAEMAPGVAQFGASGLELPEFGRIPCPGSRGELGATWMARGWHVRVLSLI